MQSVRLLVSSALLTLLACSGAEPEPFLAFVTTSVASGQVGEPYREALQVRDARGEVTFTLQSGVLPPGLVLSSAESVLAGTPTLPGTFAFILRADDTSGAAVTASLTLLIRDAQSLVLTTSELPPATAGQRYSASLTAAGGQPPLTFGIASGSLPPGLSLSASGAISGAPISAGTFSFAARVVDARSLSDTRALELTVEPGADPATLSIATWNIEWFGDEANGPPDSGLGDANQIANVRDIILGSDYDIWALQEIVDASAFSQLLAQLPDYAGVLASDAQVSRGSMHYGIGEQKLALIYRTSVARVEQAEIILGACDYDFAGRPPLLVSLQVTVGGVSSPLDVIVVHNKSGVTSQAYTRRANAAACLKNTYLDLKQSAQRFIVLGDFNDDVDVSIVSCGTSYCASPYQDLVADTLRYRFVSAGLSQAGYSSTARYADMVDHHMVSEGLASLYMAGSSAVVRPDLWAGTGFQGMAYQATTSDHYPVLSQYNLTSLPAPQVFINEVLYSQTGTNYSEELVELVNAGTTAADLGGWSLWDSSGTSARHQFGPGAVLEPGTQAHRPRNHTGIQALRGHRRPQASHGVA